MNSLVKFAVKTVSLTLLLSQATTSNTGLELLSNPVNEPVFLTVCGVALLVLGILGQSSRGAKL